MIHKWFRDGVCYIDIHCGCCGIYFAATIGGSAFCFTCMAGQHPGCSVDYIMKGFRVLPEEK